MKALQGHSNKITALQYNDFKKTALSELLFRALLDHTIFRTAKKKTADTGKYVRNREFFFVRYGCPRFPFFSKNFPLN